ncbi:MerR family transcriptional regulator [Levilactobacillus parabrevis]|uniref:MerR family transcriptional regulator n=1 Tax=Levilactobacillus parabrevis TaxID=357278 RepID=UPI0021A2B7AB|nr:MerR family transcriptional regulator [Levilactobacillus parabrevis]MCT4487576.1 MerR family transcriptional regulator [Levilactobacillus parabrevis]MCT4489022.1 MerR family transcriptional regulator [Levilactobacillus parabrevis]
MSYSIGEVADKLAISPYTLRYYDKEGLLPFVDRNAAGRRRFKDNDFNFLEVIVCLKEAGVPVKQIGDFIDLCMTGDATLQARYDFLDDHEAKLEAKMARLQHTLDFLRWKKWYYKTALQAGTESIHYLPGTNQVDPAVHAEFNQLVANGASPEKLGTLD